MRRIAAVTALVVLTTFGGALAAVGGGDVVLKNKGGDTLFSHSLHVDGAGLECTACHDKLYLSKGQHKKVTMKEMQKGKSCGACHNGKTAFSVKGDCAKCHKK
ncbi:MAG: cytochrome c3 family protein [Deltaproteobacteria bacterium]|nr:cytochrome c3 family protein [Deltaproteobacteria bacterium]